jgi:hypothetical protein
VKTFSGGSGGGGGGGVTHKTRPVRHEERREAVRIEKFRRDGFVEWLRVSRVMRSTTLCKRNELRQTGRTKKRLRWSGLTWHKVKGCFEIVMRTGCTCVWF